MNGFDAAMIQVFGENWKSTFGAYATIFIGVSGPLAGYLVLINKPWAAGAAGAVLTLSSVAKAIVGHLTIDAGTQLAYIPNQKKVEVVASHEIPNDPAAVAVTPPKP